MGLSEAQRLRDLEKDWIEDLFTLTGTKIDLCSVPSS
jgi:hypothetical protein